MIGERDARLVIELPHRFGAALDERDWPALRALLEPDVRAVFSLSEHLGAEALVGMLSGVIETSGGTYHLFANHILDDTDPERPVVRCYSRSDQVGRGERAGLRYEVLSRYRVVASRAGSAWRIAEIAMTPVFEFGDPGVFDLGTPG